MKINKKIYFKAFTLVELMIVISIVGLLVILLFPRLQGAQERSRDTGRLTSIKSMAGVLKTFSAETGKKYPNSPGTITDMYEVGDGCLSDTHGNIHNELAVFLKGEMAPIDIGKNTITNPCNTKRAMGYAPLIKAGSPGTGFALSVNMEAYKNANCDWSGVSGNICNFSFDGYTDSKDIILSPLGFLENETVRLNDSLYIEKG